MAECWTDQFRKNKSIHSENDPMGMAAGAWDFYFSQGAPLGVLQMACASNGMYLGLIQGDTEKLFNVHLADLTILYLLYLIVGAQGALRRAFQVPLRSPVLEFGGGGVKTRDIPEVITPMGPRGHDTNVRWRQSERQLAPAVHGG